MKGFSNAKFKISRMLKNIGYFKDKGKIGDAFYGFGFDNLYYLRHFQND